MINKLTTAALSIAVISFSACSNKGGSGDYEKTKDGLEYKIVKDVKEGTNPGDSDIVKVKLRMYYMEPGKKDSLLQDMVQMNGGEPLEIPVAMPMPFKGYWPAGLKFMTAGDSAVFRTPIDTFKKYSQGQPLPPFMNSKGYIATSVVLVSFKPEAEMKKEQEAKSAAQKETDDKLLQDYFTKNNLKPNKTASGLYYIIDKEGTGATPQVGQNVTVNYTGKTLDGTPFDSNVDPAFKHVEPFTFPAGKGQMIPGWDEGVMLLKKGSKARLFVPSPLAYGAQGSQALPPNSILVFNLEVTDIK